MKPLSALKGLIVVALVLITTLSFSQSTCDSEDSYLLTYQYSIPSFIQLYNRGYCISGEICDTTICFKFYPDGKNGVIYWGYSSPLGYPLTVTNISIYNSNHQLISQGQSVSGLGNSMYYVKFSLRTIYIDNFCPYFLPINPLAVDFGMVEAKQIENVVVVDWITLSETNSNYFAIQYSYDLNNWYSNKYISASANSSTNRYYTASFTPPFAGTVYVRIAEYDFNGGVTLSEIAYATYIPKANSGMLIYDLSGRLIGIRSF